MKLFVIVDYQNDFVNGSLGFPGAELLDTRILRMAKKAHKEGAIIVVTKDTHLDNYLESREGKDLPIPHVILFTNGWELYGETGKWVKTLENAREGAPSIITLNKPTFGCRPEDLLTLPDNITEIEFCGLVTNMCVLSNVCCFQARYPEAQITVYEDLCSSFDAELHNKTMDVLRGIQVHVLKSLEV